LVFTEGGNNPILDQQVCIGYAGKMGHLFTPQQGCLVTGIYKQADIDDLSRH
jgi:hypothetical protein